MLSLSSGTLFLREHDWLSLCTNWYLSGVKINSLPLHLHLFSQEKWIYLRKEEWQHLFIFSPCSSQMQPFVPASENHKALTSHASNDLAKPSSFKAQMKVAPTPGSLHCSLQEQALIVLTRPFTWCKFCLVFTTIWLSIWLFMSLQQNYVCF